ARPSPCSGHPAAVARAHPNHAVTSFGGVERPCEASHGVPQLGGAPYAGSRTTASGREGLPRSPCCLSLRLGTLPDHAPCHRKPPMASALAGLTVLDLSTGPAAALANMFLADHGARVGRLC